MGGRHAGLARALRLGQGGDRGNAVWGRVKAAVEQQACLRKCREHADDVTQLTVVKLMRTTATFRGSTDAEAFAYIGETVRNALRDLLRHLRVYSAPLVSAGREAHAPDPLDRVAMPEPDPDTSSEQAALREAALEALLDAVDARIGNHPKLAQRESAWRQAHAIILARLHAGYDAAHIADALGVPEASSDRVAKWVERGREILVPVLEALRDRTPAADPLRATFDGFLRRVAKRRVDAGKPRVERRKKTKRSVSRPKVWSSVQQRHAGARRPKMPMRGRRTMPGSHE